MIYAYAKEYADKWLNKTVFEAIREDILPLLPERASEYISDKEITMLIVQFHKKYNWQYGVLDQLIETVYAYLHKNGLKIFLRAIDDALNEYSPENIDITKTNMNEKYSILCLSDHDSVNSVKFSIAKEHIDADKLKSELDNRHISYKNI